VQTKRIYKEYICPVQTGSNRFFLIGSNRSFYIPRAATATESPVFSGLSPVFFRSYRPDFKILPITNSVARPAKQTCTNCKTRGLRFTGHTDGTCFQTGGGMEGRREKYLSNKGRIHAMFVEYYLENALDLQDPVPQDCHCSPPPSPSSHSLPILDGDVIIPPVANFVYLLSLRRIQI
jgi:hypothetical protein